MSTTTEYRCFSCHRAPMPRESFIPVELYSENRNSKTAGNRYICPICTEQWQAREKDLAPTVHDWQVKLTVTAINESDNAKAELCKLGIDSNGFTEWQASSRSIVKALRALSRLHYTHQMKVIECVVTLRNTANGEIWERTYKASELKSATLTDCTKCRKARIDRGFEQIV